MFGPGVDNAIEKYLVPSRELLAVLQLWRASQQIIFRYDVIPGPKVFETQIHGKRFEMYNDTVLGFNKSGKEVARIRMALSGRHNVLNALAAAAIAHGRGVSGEQIAAAMAEFRGVLRRLEVKGEPSGVLVVDDFAHHPTAIRVTIEAARHRWPGRKLWAVFEPRSNTMRRRVFETDLATALATADTAVLGAVNRASLLTDEERLSPERVLHAIREAGRGAKGFNSAEEIAEYLASETCPGDLVLVMSNGSFDGLCGKLIGKLQERVTPAGKFKA
jgi:UDP-N-acetylmuramate: L-alanyl-gamma-D-glutamyl-meso-diaminopimelate ligase